MHASMKINSPYEWTFTSVRDKGLTQACNTINMDFTMKDAKSYSNNWL